MVYKRIKMYQDILFQPHHCLFRYQSPSRTSHVSTLVHIQARISNGETTCLVLIARAVEPFILPRRSLLPYTFNSAKWR